MRAEIFASGGAAKSAGASAKIVRIGGMRRFIGVRVRCGGSMKFLKTKGADLTAPYLQAPRSASRIDAPSRADSARQLCQFEGHLKFAVS